MSAPRLVLASASEARAALLRRAGFSFEVRPAPEAVEARALAAVRARGGPPEEQALAAARAKAEAVAALLAAEARRAVVLGADTLVVSARGEVLGKGRDGREAAEILATLAGTRHRVLTGAALAEAPGGRRRELLAGSEVEMSPLSPAEIAAYVASGAAGGAAGAYRIQESGTDRHVRVVAGSFSNVVGLPVEEIIAVLAEFSILPAESRPG